MLERGVRRALVAGLERRRSRRAGVDPSPAVKGVDTIRPRHPLPALGVRRRSAHARSFAWRDATDCCSTSSRCPGWPTPGAATGPAGEGAPGSARIASRRIEPGRRGAARAGGCAAPMRRSARSGTLRIQFGSSAGHAREIPARRTPASCRPASGRPTAGPYGRLPDDLAPARLVARCSSSSPPTCPPTTSSPARHTLAHGINREEVVGCWVPMPRRRTHELTRPTGHGVPRLDEAEWRPGGSTATSGRRFTSTWPTAATARAASPARCRASGRDTRSYVEHRPPGDRFTAEALPAGRTCCSSSGRRSSLRRRPNWRGSSTP